LEKRLKCGEEQRLSETARPGEKEIGKRLLGDLVNKIRLVDIDFSGASETLKVRNPDGKAG
jgi:hypothetical protein